MACARVSWAQPTGERTPLDSDGAAATLKMTDDQPGARLAGMRFFSSSGLSLAYDSNAVAAPGSHEGQQVAIAQSVLRADNESEAFHVNAGAFVLARRFAQSSEQDTTEFGAATTFRSAGSAHDEFSGRFIGERRFESRNEIETPNFLPVSFYDDFRAELSEQHTFNRLALTSTVSARRVEYEDDTQRFRNLSVYFTEVRGEYQLHGDLSLVSTAYFSRDEYTVASPFAQSAHTTGALTGVRFAVPELVDFELQAGYFHRQFAGDTGTLSGVTLRGSMLWNPTQLMQVKAEVAREDQPTRITGAFGKIRTDASVEVSHAYSRDMRFYVGARTLVDDFDTIQRTDRTYLAQVGVSLQVQKSYAVRFGYDYGTRHSAAPGESFVRHIVGVSLTGRF